jgi:subtilisin family serine protease
VNPLALVELAPLTELSTGEPEIAVGLIDGPVAVDHPDLLAANVREVSGEPQAGGGVSSAARVHGTFVAGILCARRSSAAPAICPDCTLRTRPIFGDTSPGNSVAVPSATPGELAQAIVEITEAGAHVLNLSVALAQPSSKEDRELQEALNYAAVRGVIVVAAAGNQGTLGSSAITRHPWVVPVAACDLTGIPIATSNLGSSVGRRGLMAPGDQITSLGVESKPLTWGGTSVAAPFVTGTVALLWSVFPNATAAEVKSVVVGRAHGWRRTTVVPPLLDAWAAYRLMKTASGRR